jgi:hypothetical protein
VELNEEVLTIADVARDLRCSKAHVYKIINGTVPGVSPLRAILMGRRRVVLRSTLERWKRENQRCAQRDDMLAGSPEIDAVGRA